MNSTEDISLLATAIAIAALMNWLTGDRSVFGRQLLIRVEPRWTAARWLGFGMWISTTLATSSDDIRLEVVGLVGALILAFGTARKAVEKETAQPTKTNGEQDAPSNGGQRPSLNSGFHPRRG